MKSESILTSLTHEELAKLLSLSNQRIQEALDKGRKERLVAETYTQPPGFSGIYFRRAIA